MNPDAIKDGGAAYPVAMSESTYSNQNGGPFQQGMSLRDHFAGLVVQGLVASGEVGHWENDLIAKNAYGLADAMIRAREA